MPFQSSNNLRYFHFESFSTDDIRHAIFTRQGGISPSPWRSLNVGGTVGDDPERVRSNYASTLQTMGFTPEDVYDVWQVHGARVINAQAPRQKNQPHEQADVILSNQPGLTLYMRFADCVPILLYDPKKKVVGIVHAGWQGTVRKAAGAAVQAMIGEYGCKPDDIRAGIGPSIGPHHYEIGPEVVNQVRSAFGSQAGSLLYNNNGGSYFDLWGANRLILEGLGVQYIETAGICTACHLEDWYSHRGEHGRTGRFGALIALKDS